jgi:hypothetical protein
MPSTPIAPRVTPKLASLAAAVLLAPLAGCYHYVPLSAAPAAPPPAGANVRLYLTPQGMTELEPRLGPQTATVLGRVSDATERGVTLVVSETRKAYGGAAVRWIGEQVTIPAATIARAERRTLDRRRTLFAGASVLLAAVAGFALLTALNGEGRGGDDGGGPTPTP